MDNETANIAAFEPLYGGGWKVRNRKLRHPLRNSTEWLEFDAEFEMRRTLGGLATVDTFSVADWPDGGSFEGMTVRIYDTAASAHWSQAFSADGGATWETNWYMDSSRPA